MKYDGILGDLASTDWRWKSTPSRKGRASCAKLRCITASAAFLILVDLIENFTDATPGGRVEFLVQICPCACGKIPGPRGDPEWDGTTGFWRRSRFGAHIGVGTFGKLPMAT